MSDQIKFTPPTEIELNQVEHPAWDEPVICRVEVDLPGWLTKLTGQAHWEVYSEEEEDNCISFAMRSSHGHRLHKLAQPTEKALQAEVTLYHNGYAVVDVDGESLFDGALTHATNDCARLSYYHVSGEPIALN
ncbi:hypothetical protein [Methylophilus medardicus]|uniref:Uncharacterized protein n=1 Tax=Methylophilus medardicus TaxID=2588534 RepID=A0A5B8CR45_9PROT|nr:hypothetical protein [Methylophilus medardicus]QDC43728.1 hypothetical protein FIU01_03795 [Methylophilus medardicus]QDC48735.1 hypothetical protein FIU00_03795 [Methylophilus medardicus]QDC52440.1 hypothetical protein FIT99_03795 [Methylophilus medardicus]